MKHRVDTTSHQRCQAVNFKNVSKEGNKIERKFWPLSDYTIRIYYHKINNSNTYYQKYHIILPEYNIIIPKTNK